MSTDQTTEPNTGTDPATGTQPPAVPPAPDPSEGQEQSHDYSTLAELGDPDTIRTQLQHARKWEQRAKANYDAAQELERLKAERMTDSEKAVAEAEKRGRDAAMAELSGQLAEAQFRAAAAGKVADVDTVLDLVDVSKFVTDGTVDTAAIAAAVERLIKVAPATPGFGNADPGPRGGNRPQQLTRDDIKSMTPSQIEDARLKGQLNSLLGIDP